MTNDASKYFNLPIFETGLLSNILQQLYQLDAFALSIRELFGELAKFQESLESKTSSLEPKNIFNCIMTTLCNEFTHDFPDLQEDELHKIAQLFGDLIQYQFVTKANLKEEAMEIVLNTLSDCSKSERYSFGLTALNRFKNCLKSFPQYVQRLRSISDYKYFPSDLIELLDSVQNEQEAPKAPEAPEAEYFFRYLRLNEEINDQANKVRDLKSKKADQADIESAVLKLVELRKELKELRYKAAMTFQKQDSLTTHYRSHTGEKPFVCEICDRSFTSEKNKKVHVQRHQGSLPHRCDVCGMTFQSRSHLIKHATR